MMQKKGENLEAKSSVEIASHPDASWAEHGAIARRFNQVLVGRECWLPNGWPVGSSICLASSRLGRKLDQHDQWFDAIRTLAVQLNPLTHFLVTSAGTTTDLVTRRIAQLFAIPLLELIYLESAPTERWKVKQFPMACENDPPRFRFYLWQTASTSPKDSKPHFSSVETKMVDNKKSRSAFPVDRDLIELADEVYLLSVRRGGNIHQAAISRLQGESAISENEHPPAARRTWLLIEKSLSPKSVERELLDAGAFAWWLFHDEPNSDSLPSMSMEPDCGNEASGPTNNASSLSAPVLELSEIDGSRYLIHWTRRRNGPWPGQSPEAFLDDLIFQTGRRQHDEVATLRRIVATGRIEATQRLTRVTHPVVCFANINLDEISSKQIFRSHLGRWDFLPYGIAIVREALQKLDARAVIYGDESTWESLDELDRPFFQLAKSNSGTIDWREEHEWRFLGDLDLHQFDIGEIVVFVKKATDALSIAEYSRWPIVVLND